MMYCLDFNPHKYLRDVYHSHIFIKKINLFSLKKELKLSYYYYRDSNSNSHNEGSSSYHSDYKPNLDVKVTKLHKKSALFYMFYASWQFICACTLYVINAQ